MKITLNLLQLRRYFQIRYEMCTCLFVFCPILLPISTIWTCDKNPILHCSLPKIHDVVICCMSNKLIANNLWEFNYFFCMMSKEKTYYDLNFQDLVRKYYLACHISLWPNSQISKSPFLASFTLFTVQLSWQCVSVIIMMMNNIRMCFYNFEDKKRQQQFPTLFVQFDDVPLGSKSIIAARR